jgi:hypothetical protein
MAKAKTPDLFLDTSIQIARQIHGPQTKAAIKKRLSKHSKHVTSLVVRQEFKRRLLKEAAYLLGLLHRYKSFDEVHQHVIRLFGSWHQRKRTICLQTLAQLHEASDAERTERLRLVLRSLLVTGLRRFDQTVDEIREESKCACARQEVVEKVEFRDYELGIDKCSRASQGACGIREFLEKRTNLASKIALYFQAIPPVKKSAEIQKAEKFLAKIANDPATAVGEDPCLTVGDLLIAMESAGISHFFTMNSAESQHFCRVLGQAMIVQPVVPTKPEIVCLAEDEKWPEFGVRTASDSTRNTEK